MGRMAKVPGQTRRSSCRALCGMRTDGYKTYIVTGGGLIHWRSNNG